MSIKKEELYKYAAIAATYHYPDGSDADYIKSKYWDPLESSDDAFDLMVRCQMTIGDYICGDYHDWAVLVTAESRWYDSASGSCDRQEFYSKGSLWDVKSSFREAIVNTAYELGKYYVEKGYCNEG